MIPTSLCRDSDRVFESCRQDPIENEATTGSNSVILQQVTNGLAVRMGGRSLVNQAAAIPSA